MNNLITTTTHHHRTDIQENDKRQDTRSGKTHSATRSNESPKFWQAVARQVFGYLENTYCWKQDCRINIGSIKNRKKVREMREMKVRLKKCCCSSTKANGKRGYQQIEEKKQKGKSRGGGIAFMASSPVIVITVLVINVLNRGPFLWHGQVGPCS